MVNLTPEQRKKSVEKAKATRKRNKEIKAAQAKAMEKRALELRYNIDALEEELASLEFKKLVHKVGARLSNETLPYPEQIIANAEPFGQFGGVYFLIKNYEIVYVGQSVNVFSRIQQHVDCKDFDTFTYVPLPKGHFDRVESFYIHTLRPKLNGTRGNYNNQTKSAPLTLEEAIGYPSGLADAFITLESRRGGKYG